MADDPPTSRILILTQTYVPDSSATGQLLHDVATTLVGRGHKICILTANRDYNDSNRRYPLHEMRDGVEIRRVPVAQLSKSSIIARVAVALSFVIQVILSYRMFLRGLDVILVSTASPLTPFPALIISWIHRIPLSYWIHDLHPDLAIKVGAIARRSPLVGMLNWLNRRILRHSKRVIVLDEYMAKQIQAKQDVASKIIVIPPWAPFDEGREVQNGHNPWREKYLSTDSHLIMFSGNHSLIHPLDTLLKGAQRLRDNESLKFFFVGGGLGKREIEDVVEMEGLQNIKCLPFQQLGDLVHSLSAADVHVVSIGNGTVGLSHPCKIYGAMGVGRPLLLFGSESSPAAQIINRYKIGWCVPHGDIENAVEVLKEIQRTSSKRLVEMGEAAKEVARRHYSRHTLCGRFCDEMEAILRLPRP